jgi:uncharacterized membrane protein
VILPSARTALIALIAVIASGLGSGWAGWTFSRDYHAAKAIETQKIIEDTARVSRQAAAEAISGIEVKNVRITQKLETEIREKPVYRDCVADERVFTLTNEAITGEESGDPSVPAAGGDVGPDVR